MFRLQDLLVAGVVVVLCFEALAISDVGVRVPDDHGPWIPWIRQPRDSCRCT